MKRAILLAMSALILGAISGRDPLVAQDQQPFRFPHEIHAGFFSECSACHTVSPSGTVTYPEPSLCSACHDGSTAPNISWRPPAPRPTNLHFTHVPHDFGCESCHLPAGDQNLADMQIPKPEVCLGCHAPQAPSHLQAVDYCGTCHVPVVQSTLTETEVATIPAPPSHASSSWAVAHGAEATSNGTECAICHDRTSCFTCHGGAAHLPEAILSIPAPEENGPHGVQVPPPSVTGFHPPGWTENHAAAASVGQPECTSCHSEDTCTSCHDAQGSPSFHPLNFLASHGPEAYGRVTDCTSCHNSEAFCRECHLGLGLKGGEGKLVAPFHDGQSLWILSHPQAARQDLESCVSCHKQTDCLRCHSATSGLGINPHGPSFDPSALRDLNKSMCEICHLPGSIGGGP